MENLTVQINQDNNGAGKIILKHELNFFRVEYIHDLDPAANLDENKKVAMGGLKQYLRMLFENIGKDSDET